jgi:hypothetical protein
MASLQTGSYKRTLTLIKTQQKIQAEPLKNRLSRGSYIWFMTQLTINAHQL